jgi:aspartate/glutamate racemase
VAAEIRSQQYRKVALFGTAAAVLSQIAYRLPVDAIILAGTDLSLVFNRSNNDFPHIDCAELHIRSIARAQRSSLPIATPV